MSAVCHGYANCCRCPSCEPKAAELRVRPERRLWKVPAISEDEFRAQVLRELKILNAVQREPKCLGRNLRCRIPTRLSWCHQHRAGYLVNGALRSLDDRIESLAVEITYHGRRDLESTVLELQERGRIALADLNHIAKEGAEWWR